MSGVAIAVPALCLHKSLHSATVGTGHRHPVFSPMPGETSTAKKRAALDKTWLIRRLRSVMAQLNNDRDPLPLTTVGLG
ncbi:MAG: hypothetical protein K4304_06805 [Propionicimonas sp.]